MAEAYEALNRFDEAKSIAEQAVAEKADGIAMHFVLTDLAYMRGDRAAYEHELELAKGHFHRAFPALLQCRMAGRRRQGQGRARTLATRRSGKHRTRAPKTWPPIS